MIKDAASEGGGQIVAVPTDIAHEDQVNHLIEFTVRQLGRLDYAVNAAGVLGSTACSTETPSHEFDRINGINYRGCWLSSRAELAQMLKQDPLPTHDGRMGNRGSIVNIASALAFVGRQNAPAYCGSKAAVVSLTRCDAIDYAQDNIRVNCVCPGIISTPMTEPQMGILGPAIGIAPMNRTGTAQEVADAVLFLCSSKATFIQGAALSVDGGYIIN
ncbi:NAD(P)-binding protein [Polychaeton citri CBS 116435]|uniref:NAD(P)-binding protein n=1 Tax=Polychaeton citri CBS 116435 TaxID=1314669 RepID=A0A9P4QIX4_9PEZI|nr:NAD(P)-binding protein [Polychaeton citri CBS 116435]